MFVDRMPGVHARSCERDRQLDATIHATHLSRPRPILGRLIEHHPVILATEALAFTLGTAEMDPALAAGAVLREGDVLFVVERPDDLDITARSPFPSERLHLVSGDPHLHGSALGEVLLVRR